MKIFQRLAIFTIFLAVLSGCEKVWDTSGYDPLPSNPSENPDDGGNDNPGPSDPSDPSDDQTTTPGTPSISPAYQITGGVITRTVLNNYLSRAITESEYLSNRGSNSDGFWGTDDDQRMLLNVGAKFIGRAIYSWGKEDRFNSLIWLPNAKNKVDAYHQQDPDAIFQASVFEIVTTKVNSVPIPEWVFTAFGKTPENRNFNYDSIKNLHGAGVNYWGTNTCVPDMSREETQMWFYYQIVRYMEVGCEAVHMGQVKLISELSGGDYSHGYSGYKRLIDLVRQAAKTKARRGIILLDAHKRDGLIINGTQYLDFVSYPLRLREKTNESATLGASFAVNYLDSVIGKTAGMLYILEFDNFGTSSHPGTASNDHYVWGYDDITWFAKLSFAKGCEFLDYAVDFLAKNDPNGHIQMPGLRVVQLSNKTFRCNNRSADCEDGYGYEDKIKQIWSK